MKNTKKIIYILMFSFIFLLIGTVKSNAGSLKLNDLDFNVQINNDGSMDVTEIWDINIKETNTLYKSFKTDSKKYSGITNVTVKEITNGQNINFTKTNEWAYHVKKNYYYGTENEDNNFEIGWGVGLDNSSGTRKYEISYTVKDAITKYNDYSELYWQFIGEDFEVPADRITGTIYLPSNVSNQEDIKVWGHTEDLNGTIYATDLNKIEFELNDFRSGRYVEIRTLFPTELITYSGRTKNTEILQTAIKEETKWADEANARRERQEWIEKNLAKVLFIGWAIINVILIVFFIRKTIKYLKKIKELKKYEPTTKLEYYRDIPDENSAPGEAVKILNMKVTAFSSTNFGKIFSATMLDLTLKGYLDVRKEKNEKGKDIINICILKEATYELKPSEARIMKFILEASKGEESLTIKELEKYIKNHPSKTETLLSMTYDDVNKQLIKEEIIDSEMQKECAKYRGIQVAYIFAIVFLLFFTFVAFIIPIIILTINAFMCGIIAKKLNVLTQKGVDLQEQWKGLKKFMEDFSRLDKREVPELIVWEKYLVYATAFGIADKVIKQLKMVYPNFEEMTTGIGTYAYMNIMMNTNFSSSFSSAISSSISSATYSSGSGSVGGFSGGGGGGRRPEAAVAGR